jgi:hypothetical protein
VKPYLLNNYARTSLFHARKGELIAVFHAPQPFFDCLQERISLGSKKKRLPNTTTTFIRKVANRKKIRLIEGNQNVVI